MHRNPSRKEKRETKFYYLAEQGGFEASPRPHLYTSEEKSLKKSGFDTLRRGDNKKGSLPTDVSWRNAFREGIPPIVYSYIVGEIETFPKTDNWAQELYVIAARANYERKLAKKNNE